MNPFTYLITLIVSVLLVMMATDSCARTILKSARFNFDKHGYIFSLAAILFLFAEVYYNSPSIAIDNVLAVKDFDLFVAWDLYSILAGVFFSLIFYSLIKLANCLKLTFLLD